MLSSEKIQQLVLDATSEVSDLPIEKLQLQDSFTGLRLDSLDTIDVLMVLEDKLDIDLDAAIDQVETLQDVVDWVEKKIKGKRGTVNNL